MSNIERETRVVRVLYVDDSIFDRELVRDALENKYGNFEVTEASSRKEFEARLHEKAYDLVVSDFHIRGFDGLDVIDMVHAKDGNLPVVIVTGTGSEQEAVQAMKRGAADYVIKSPKQILQLPGILLAALERRQLREAHLRAEDAQRFLVQASSVLASSLDYEAILTRLANLAVPGLASFCAIQLADDKVVGGVTAAILQPRSERLVQNSWRPGQRGTEWREAVRRTVRGEEPQFLEEIPNALLSVLAGTPEQFSLLRTLRFSSLIAAPIVARGRPLGLLLLGCFREDRKFGQEELSLAGELAGRVALAVDNTRLYREAREAISVRDEFLAVAAHELKTPVTSLKGFAQLTARLIERGDCVDLERVKQAMEIINQQSDKLDRLVTRLLDMSRMEGSKIALEVRRVDAAQLARESVERASVSNGDRSIHYLGPASAVALIDPIRIEQVLNNLLDNALKFSPNAEPVDVEVTVPNAATVCLAVRDRGIGIPPEHRQRVFDRFYQAHGDGALGGMGLGLYISRCIVELHGGSIEVDFPQDGGTRFVVILPTGIEGSLDTSGAALVTTDIV